MLGVSKTENSAKIRSVKSLLAGAREDETKQKEQIKGSKTS